MTKVCVNQSYFQFRDDYYKQTDGLAMGLSLSPFLCNLYMVKVENQLKQHTSFPRFYHRYVDDCLAIVHIDKIDETLKLLNSACPAIQFTCEVEINNEIPFLDLKIQRQNNGNISFNIHRKDTCTDRYIPTESNHHHSHKTSAFNSMIHRLVNVPLSPNDFNTEKEKILHIADINGMNPCMIENLIKKHQHKMLLKNCTSLSGVREVKWCAMTYDSHTFNSLHSSLKSENIALAPKSTTKLKSLLNSTKDKCSEIDKPGIYKASCADCGRVYIGQTRRSLKVRKKEHISYIGKIEPYKSGLAEHIISCEHHLNDDSFKLIRSESNCNRLNILESMHIYLNKNNLNRDIGPHYSSLFHTLDKHSK